MVIASISELEKKNREKRRKTESIGNTKNLSNGKDQSLTRWVREPYNYSEMPEPQLWKSSTDGAEKSKLRKRFTND